MSKLIEQQKNKPINGKEKIAELLNDVDAKGFWRYNNGEEGHDMTPEDIADYLIENGVTIKMQITVSDLLHEEK